MAGAPARVVGVLAGLGPGQGLVLAARTDDYRAAVHPAAGAEVLLTGAAGIELCPLESSVVADYLRDSAGGPEAAGRWESVIATFTAKDPPPAAQALSTPLMAALARVAYNPRPGEDMADIQVEPVELLDSALFPSREAVEDYLFDRFVPASYRQHPNPSHPPRRYKWSAEQAERWLAFLARSLEDRQGGSTDLAWWKLPSAAPRHLVGVALGLAAAAAASIGFPFVGLGVGITLGLLAGLIARRKVRRKTGLAQALAGGLIGGIIAALTALAVLGPGVRGFLLGSFLSGGLAVGITMRCVGGFIPAFTAGFVGEITIAFYEHVPLLKGLRTAVGSGSHLTNAFGVGLAALLFVKLAGRGVPARGIRWSPAWFGCGLVTAVVLGFVTWAQEGWVAGLAVGIAAISLAGWSVV